ncbi:MAG TPA: ATP-binding protein [Actinomycetota bacterium]|nr:ATP-binding protein [Actinomycetota bacterium]
MPEESFVLEIPPLPAHVGTARLFVGSVARQFGVEEDAVEDAKIGVSEACTSAIRLRDSAGGPEPVRVRIQPDAERLTFQVDDAVRPEDDDPELSTTDDLIRSLGLELVRSLFPDAETIKGEDGTALRFGVPL